MRHFTALKFLTAVVVLTLTFGLVQAQQVSRIEGTVTYNGEPMPQFALWVSAADTSLEGPVWTNMQGKYSFPAIPGTYNLAIMDTFSFQPLDYDVTITSVMGEVKTQDFELTARQDLSTVSGNISFEGSGVSKDIYFLKLADSVDLNDFREYEVYFNVPKIALRWAHYSAESDDNGDFSLAMLDGKYVFYIPQGEQTLAFWGVAEAMGDTQLDDIVLKKMTTITGTVNNITEKTYPVTVMAHGINAMRPAMATPDSNGNYTLNVAPGDYLVRVQTIIEGEHMYMEFWNGNPDSAAHTPKDAEIITVPQEGVTGIDFTLPDVQISDFSISGYVTSSNSGKALAGAEVAFVSYNFSTNLYKAYDTETDENGYYKIEGQTLLKEDSLVGFAAAEGFFAQFYDGKATFLNADPIVYYAGEDVENINFMLDSIDTENAYRITGHVYDEEGKIVPQGQVTAYTTDTNVGVATTKIDSNGFYAFDSIFTQGSSVYLQAWGGFGYLPGLYSEDSTVQKWEDADALSITDHDVTGIDFTLKLVGASRMPIADIKGKMNLGGGNTLAKAASTTDYDGATVYVRAEGSSKWTASDYVDANGNFSLGVEGDGNYEVMITTKSGYSETQDVTVEQLESESVEFQATSITDEPEAVISTHQLHDAYPNPFNPRTTIKIDLSKTTEISLVIYNVLGQKVKTLFNGELAKGTAKFTWNGNDNFGKQVASGLYFYQLKTQNTVQTKAVMFLK